MQNIFEINLQLFAEGENTEGGAQSAPAETEGADGKGEKLYTQAEINTIINQRFAKLQREADERVENARNEGMTEGERLARMSEDERRKAEQEKAESEFSARKAELDKREAEVSRRELQAQAVETLTGKGLPAGLAKYLNYTDADACSASIAEVEKDFGEMLKAEVDKRLAGSSAQLSRGGGAQENPKGKDVEIAEQLGSAARKSTATYKTTIDQYK